MDKNFRIYDPVYLILLDYMKSKYDASGSTIAIRTIIRELELVLVYTPTIGVSFAFEKDASYDTRPAMLWWKVKDVLLKAKKTLLASSDNDTLELAKLIYPYWKEADPRWRAMDDHMRIRCKKYNGTVDGMAEDLIELDVELRYLQRGGGLSFRKIGSSPTDTATLPWNEVKEKLEEPNMRVKLLTSSSELARSVGRAYE